MLNKRLFISVLIGAVAGQIFAAEGDLPLSVINTVRVGYDDNVERRPDGEGSAFFRDMLDLSFNASLSDRTDLTAKSRFDFATDTESHLNPNLYVVLTHSVSQRLLLQVSDKFRRDQVTSTFAEGRYDYFENTVSFTPSYILSPVDRLTLPMSYTIERHEEAIDMEDTDVASVGLSWRRDLSPQRTWAALHTKYTMAEYPNRDASYNGLLLTGEISHTFNPEWQGVSAIGFSLDESEYTLLGNKTTSSGVNPYLSLGLVYTPSPRTRLSGKFSHKYRESDNSNYAGETSTELRFDAQHDFTAKLQGKAWAKFADKEYGGDDNENGGGSSNQDLMELACYLNYKLNRINYLELGYKHRQKQYEDSSRDWDSNRIELGWRLEL